MSEEAIAYWNERASEKIGHRRVSKEFEDEYNRTHPLLTDEELVEIFLDAGDLSGAEDILKRMKD